VQLPVARAARARRSSAARDSRDDGPRVRRPVAALYEDVFGYWSAVDSPRAVAARVGVAVALHRTERALADGGDRLQRVVSMVCRVADGRPDLVADDGQQESDRLLESDIAGAF